MLCAGRKWPFLILLAAVGAALLISALIGVGTALTNGLPFLGIDNDGHNIAVLVRSKEARDAFYTQLEVVSRLARGGRLRDVPEEIFGGGDHALTNAITAVVPVFLAERKLDSGDIPGALEALEGLAAKESGLTQSMRGPVICDLIFDGAAAADGKHAVVGQQPCDPRACGTGEQYVFVRGGGDRSERRQRKQYGQ